MITTPPTLHILLRGGGSFRSIAFLLGMLVWTGGALSAPAAWLVAAREDNDLVRVLRTSGVAAERLDDAAAAVANAGKGDGVLVLADAYPKETTALTPALFETARAKGIRLYVEYPSFLPDLKCGAPQTLRTGHWGNILDRTVVASDAFGDRLKKLRILMIHDCHYLPVEARRPHLVVARVAGYDEALHGLPQDNVHPILFEHPAGEVLVATTKLSQFVTARYAPLDAWEPVWRMILKWAQPDADLPALRWSPPLRPSFSRDAELPADVERQALQRGAEWYGKSGLLVHPSWQGRYELPANDGPPTADWPDGHRAGPGPGPAAAAGDGSLGLLEGFRSKIYHDGSQPVLWWRRADNHGESAGALALAGSVLQQPEFSRIGGNLADWLTGKSILYNGVFADPEHPAFSLCGWNDVPRYYHNANGFDQLWGDDNARAWLGLLRAATALRTNRYDERLAQQLLAMIRLTGNKGFIVKHLDVPSLARNGWEGSFLGDHEDLSPHYQAYVQACFLWAARATGFPLLQERATKAIARMMEAYPHGWSATNDQFNQERARMLLPLAWLVRLDDTPEHREWLRRVATDLTSDMDACGAILTKISAGPASNEAYGTGETTLIQANGDPNTDLFYTANFALVGLHEAAAATGEALYRDAEDKLVRFFCRVQVQSDSLPQFDGGWFRGFDYRRWEYWGSDADIGWSLYSMETGWIQGEVLSVLALRQMETSLWDFTAASGIPAHFEAWRGRMLPEEVLKKTASEDTDGAGRVANDAGHNSKPGAKPDAAPPPSAPASSRLGDEAYRPQFHFSYQKGWMSDINGLFYHQGEYHFFSQHNPAGPGLDYPNIHWGHAVSRDLLHWTVLPPALAPDEDGPIFSGSSVVDWNNTSGLQTGRDPVIVAFYTSASYILSAKRNGTQCMAYSNNRGQTWTKYAGNPVLPALTHYNRDPKVFWHEPTGKWVMVISLSCADHWLLGRDGDYRFAFFSSPDLKKWKEMSRFDMPRGLDCPDMFELPVDGQANQRRWVLWAGDGTHAIGTFDGTRFVPTDGIRLPLLTWEERGANGYAAQTFSDLPASDGRRIQIAWLRALEHGGYPGMPFNQQALFPVELTLRKVDGRIQLFREPVREISQLRGREWKWNDHLISPGENLLSIVEGELFELRTEIEPRDAKTISFRVRGATLTYDPAHRTLSCLGKTVSAGSADGRLRLHLLIDRTTLEIFADQGRTSLSFFLDPGPRQAPLDLTVTGGRTKIRSLHVWELNSIWGRAAK